LKWTPNRGFKMRVPLLAGMAIMLLLILIVVGCAPTHTDTDQKISGNLIDIEFIEGSTSEYSIAIIYFEDGTIHTLKSYNGQHNEFKKNRLHEIYYNSMGAITKVEILE
jgi:hypothetical protein